MQYPDSPGAREVEAVKASEALKFQLVPGENVLASVVVDLDDHLRFASGLLALTDQRLLARDGASGAWREWPLAAPQMALQLSDHAGVGTLDLVDGRQLLGRWYYTLAGQAAALRLL